MKSIPSVVFLIACLFLCACQSDKKETEEGKTIGALFLSDATPNPGTSLQIAYSPKTDISEPEVKGYFYYLVNTNIYGQDLSLKDSSEVMKATVSIPDSATAIAFNFVINDINDTNGKKGFVIPLFNKRGKMVPGAKASKGYYYLRVGRRLGLEMGKNSILGMIQWDIDQHPEIKSSWDIVYARMLYGSDAGNGENYINERLGFYSEKTILSEADYLTLKSFHQILQHKAKVDSLLKVITKKYPQGSVAQRKYFMDFRKANDLAKREEMLTQYDSNEFNGKGQYKDIMVRFLATTYLKNNNLDKFLTISEKASDKTKASLYNKAARNLAEKRENLEMASKISKKSLQLIDMVRENPKRKQDYTIVSIYLSRLARNYQMYADTYAFILFEQGKIDEAVVYQEKAVGKGKNVEINEHYVGYLLAAGNSEKAQKVAAGYIKNNVATVKTKGYFKEAYVKNNKSELGFEEKLAAMKKVAHEKALIEMKEEMVNKPAPKFSMMDLEGNKISLASLKGKTVILDFWATWCAPCKASFPGMQKAVEKYQDDPKVAFFFVNTMETGMTPEERNKKVGGFIDRKGYSFHVLLDGPAKEGSRNCKTAVDYGIGGIPTKIIIGPKGNIKFKKVGYDGNNKRMLEEIEMMIELSQSSS